MHSKMIDLSRTAACWRDTTAHPDAESDDRRVSVMWFVVPVFAFWCGVIAWWLS